MHGQDGLAQKAHQVQGAEPVQLHPTSHGDHVFPERKEIGASQQSPSGRSRAERPSRRNTLYPKHTGVSHGCSTQLSHADFENTGGQSKIAFCPQGHFLSQTGSGWALWLAWAK